jgi:mono/diheme cytochrome c family protein
MKRAVLLLLATMGLMPAVGFAEAASPPNGEALFNANCARCHDRALPRMPSRAGLKEKDARDVFTTISAGVMAPYTRQLSHDERRAVAEYAAGKSLGDFATGAAAIPKAAYCSGKAAAALGQLDQGWNGWGGSGLDNTRFQTAERAGLKASQVPKLKVKRDWHVNMDPNFVDSYVMNSMFDHEGSGYVRTCVRVLPLPVPMPLRMPTVRAHVRRRLPSLCPPLPRPHRQVLPAVERAQNEAVREQGREEGSLLVRESQARRARDSPCAASVHQTQQRAAGGGHGDGHGRLGGKELRAFIIA